MVQKNFARMQVFPRILLEYLYQALYASAVDQVPGLSIPIVTSY
jgi:hypothetical protein